MQLQSEDPILAWAERGPIIAIGAELRALLSAEAVPRILRRAERLGEDAREAGTLYLVDHGRVRLGRAARDGREVVLAIACPGSLCYLLSVHAYLEALGGGTRIYCLAARPLLALISAHPPIMSWLAALLGQHLTEAYDRIEELTCCSVWSRVAHALGKLALAAPDGMVRIGQMELAQSAGTSREEVSRALRDLRAAGQVADDSCRGTIRVLDVAGLLRA